MNRLACTILAAATLLTCSATAEATTTVLATQRASTKVSALRGHVVWSAYDGTRHRFTLMDWHAGRSRPLPVGHRSINFDADLGTDHAGRLVVTYSRCRKEPVALFNGQWPDPEPARRCRLYQLVIGARRPSALGPEPPAGHVYLTPSRWRDRLAFLDWRAHPKRATVRWMRLGATGGRRRYTLPAGRQGDEFGAGPSTIDLRGTRIAYDWHADLPDDVVRCPHSSGDPTSGVDEYDVFAGRLPSMVGRLEQGCTFDAIQQAHSPSVPDSPGPVPYLISGPPHDFTPQLRTRSGAAVTDRAIWPTGSIVDSISLDAGLIALSQSTDGAHWQVVVTRR